GSGGQTQGFDWNAAAQDRSPSSGADALGTDPGLGDQPPGDQDAARGTKAPAENLAPGPALNRSSAGAQGQPMPQTGGDPSGTYSQADVDRAKALAEKFSPEDLDRAKALAEKLSPEDLERVKALAGTYSQEDVDRAKALGGLSSLVNPSLAAK